MNMTRLNYIELPVTDLDAAKGFYQAAFGWAFTDYGPTYAAAQRDNLEVGLNAEGTVGPLQAEGDQNGLGPLLLFETDDLEDALTRITGADGVIVSKPYDYPGGRRFHFRDPSGNVLGVYCSQT